MQEPTFLILAALAAQPRHGYGIVQAVADMSAGEVKLRLASPVSPHPPGRRVTAETWPAADERLVRSYRRLLLAYSGAYRRRHGTEMITTLLEMAEPGRTRPPAGEAWHLITSGVRQRFRLPARRPFAWVAGRWPGGC